MTLVPAYGRDYKSAKAVREAWIEGKDFQIADMFSADSGRYINNQDCPTCTINIRYNKLMKLVVISHVKVEK